MPENSESPFGNHYVQAPFLSSGGTSEGGQGYTFWLVVEPIRLKNMFFSVVELDHETPNGRGENKTQKLKFHHPALCLLGEDSPVYPRFAWEILKTINPRWVVLSVLPWKKSLTLSLVSQMVWKLVPKMCPKWNSDLDCLKLGKKDPKVFSLVKNGAESHGKIREESP